MEYLIIVSILCGIPLAIILYYLRIRYLGRKIESEYKGSKQFENRKKEFIEKARKEKNK
jgi:H+/gluconate symporter-like permease